MGLEEIEHAEAAAHATNVFLEVRYFISFCTPHRVHYRHPILITPFMIIATSDDWYEDCPTSSVPKMSIAPFILHIYTCP
jgi:hypothetical protein